MWRSKSGMKEKNDILSKENRSKFSSEWKRWLLFCADNLHLLLQSSLEILSE